MIARERRSNMGTMPTEVRESYIRIINITVELADIRLQENDKSTKNLKTAKDLLLQIKSKLEANESEEDLNKWAKQVAPIARTLNES